MQPTTSPGSLNAGMDVIAKGLESTILHHQEQGQQQFTAVLDSQKQLTASLRTIMQALDQIQTLVPPQATPEQLSLLKGLPLRAKALQSKLHIIEARLVRIKGLVDQQEHRRQQNASSAAAQAQHATINTGSNEMTDVT